MGRTTHSGPIKSTGGFEVGAVGTNTEVIDSSGNYTGGGSVNAKSVVTSITGNATLTAAQSGTVFLCGSVAATVTLPATVAGVIYTILISDATGAVQIRPNASDKIQGKGVPSVSGAVTLVMGGTDGNGLSFGATTAAVVGDRAILVGDGGDGWIILEAFGAGLADVT